ncbi:hydantoinase/oxoprolinase family protein [Desulfosporosinus lacus]|uniref:Hydantoinase A/oxoprolinase domain-containing protein n=1 Tax=Desulfosporosinus lacus DSM 15449 TaxID=1121420 RepID=A0A1M5ZZX8_9FIRM|nr:hydantoinase/oxoprolinase family protein [Desulfosporosinus lacus]SHI29804.1 hypothetical protein SAMN02746098_03838 [Desulfosporosinus lacus DSM 15449]
MSVFMGLDIGGANTKVCWVEMQNGRVVRAEGESVYHEVWRDPEGLQGVLETFKYNREMGDDQTLQGVALTMTAELCDIFKSKSEGVRAILDLVEQVFRDIPLYVWTTRGVFVSPSQTREKPLDAAAANWLASATALARSPLVNHDEAAFLVDMGSTTTDILPLFQGEVVVKGRTDLERLLYGELVYTGVLRTQVQAIVDYVHIKGLPCKVTSEYFSITADVYRLLNLIREEDYDVATPDGAGRDIAACVQRLARVVASDPEEFGQNGVYALARFIQEKQLQQVLDAVWQLLSRLEQPWPKRLIMASQGSFLLREVARRLEWEAIPWWECIPGAKEGYALTAYAVAWLLAGQLEVN